MCLFPSAKVKCSLALRWEAQITLPNSKKPIWTLGNNLTQFQDTSMPFPCYYSPLNNLCEGKGTRNNGLNKEVRNRDEFPIWLSVTFDHSNIIYTSFVEVQCETAIVGPEPSFCPLVSKPPYIDLFHSKIPSFNLFFIISLLKIKSVRNLISVWKTLPSVSTLLQRATSNLIWT